MDKAQYLKNINAFESHYHYDSTYMRELLEHSPEGYAKFDAFIPLSGHRERLTVDVFWVAKLAAMQVADCGHCLQLNIRMALEQGANKDYVKTAIHGGSKLPEELKDVFDFATGVASFIDVDPVLRERITQQFSRSEIVELGVCIATVSIYPTLKRTLGYTKSCSLIEFEI